MYESIIENINNQNWVKAIKEIGVFLRQDIFDETLAILAATVFIQAGNLDEGVRTISRGLKINPRNYELWLLLGQIYENKNANQAYLCYENALFYATDEDDKSIISQYIDRISNCSQIKVEKTSIVILSYNSLNYTKECIESIRNTCPESAYEIIVVDNNSQDNSVDWLKKQHDIKLQCNDYNAGFPGGCNQGIAMAEETSDIFLLNNDAILTTNSLFWLRMGLYESDNVGATGAMSNFVSNYQKVNWNLEKKEDYLKAGEENNIPMDNPYSYRTYLVGFAMLISRKAYNEVGGLDEIFFPGTWEDTDYGFKLCKAGYDVTLCKNSFIYHYGSGGGKNLEKWRHLNAINSSKIYDKWGFDFYQYSILHLSIVEKIKEPIDKKLTVLVVGCGLGNDLLALMERYPNGEFYGIENNKNVADVIPKRIKSQVCGMETGIPALEDKYFDYIIFADVYEKSYNQPALIKKYEKYLKDTGKILTNAYEIEKRDINFMDANDRSIAVGVCTHNHIAQVNTVLYDMALVYYFYGIDVYFFDSSQNRETEDVINFWKNKGYDNLYYIRDENGTPDTKIYRFFSGFDLKKEYKYLWPTKDRSIWKLPTIRVLCNNMCDCDALYLEVRMPSAEREYTDIVSPTELYEKHCLGLTSLDTTLYSADIIKKNREVFEKSKDIKAFSHFYMLFQHIAKIDRCKVRVFHGKDIILHDVPTKSGWEKEAFHIWKDCWIYANKQLDGIYNPYKDYVIKYVVSMPWIIGGYERIKELIMTGNLTQESASELKNNWEKISDISFDKIYSLLPIAVGKEL